MTPSHPTMPPPDPMAMVLCAMPYSVPEWEGGREEEYEVREVWMKRGREDEV